MTDSKKEFEIAEHVSDVKLKVFGSSLEELFVNAARGMFSFISQNKKYNPETKQDVSISLPPGTTREDLLLAWLEKLLFYHETKNLLFFEFKIHSLFVSENIINKKTGSALKASLYGEYIDLKKHEILIHIKGPTYHDFQITYDKSTKIFKAEIVFDI